MKKINKSLAFASILSIALTLTAFAEEKTFEKEIAYHAGKGDNESTSRVIAVDQASKLLLEAVVEALKADQSAAKPAKTKKTAKKKKGKAEAKAAPTYEVTGDSIILAAGALPVEIADDKWDGSDYRLKATVKTDVKVLAQHLRNLSGDKEEKKTLAEFNAKTSALNADIERLGKEFDATGEAKTAAEYSHAATTLEALEFFIKGYSLGTVGNVEASVKAFDKSIEIDKDNPYAYTGRGYAYETMGAFKKAVDDYNRAVELAPKDPANYNNRGNVLDSLGDHNRAIDDYDHALELDPNNAKAYSNRGTSYSEIGDYPHALEDFNRSIALDPNVPIVYVNRGIVYAKMEDNLKSLEDLKKAAKMGLREAQEVLENQGIKWEE
jgi:tetratricopeptide (TPR) repeat protein